MDNQLILLFSLLKALVNDWSLSAGQLSQLVYHRFELLIYQNFSADSASLVLSMILGRNSGLDSELRLKFKVIGMLHVACVSGFNVGLVCSVIKPIVEPVFSKKVQGWALIALTWGYTSVAQGGVALLRAAIMASINIIGSYCVLRSRSSVRSLYLTLFVLLVMNPSWLELIGLQLSAAATWGILVLPEALRFYLELFLRRFELRLPQVGDWTSPIVEALTTSCCAWIATLPLVWHYFQELSWWGLLANSLLLWLVPLITVSGLIWASFSLVMPVEWLVQLTSLPTAWLTQFFLKGVELIGSQARLTQLGELSWERMIGCYLGLYAAVSLYKILKNLETRQVVYWEKRG